MLSARSRDTELRINLVTRNLECPAVLPTLVEEAHVHARGPLMLLFAAPLLLFVPFGLCSMLNPPCRLQITRAISLFPRRFRATPAAYEVAGSFHRLVTSRES